MAMCGQTWSDSALSFLGMWIVMMAAMMLPSFAPVLQRYRRAVGSRPTALVGAGYFFVWSLVGVIVFPLGVAWAALETPLAVGVVVLVAGLVQFTTWKARRLGLDCVLCCANLMAILLVIGVMDLATMALVTAAITLERLTPAGEKLARAVGVVVVGTGLFLIACAIGLG
jgi:predicted metal-binding membrane protein